MVRIMITGVFSLCFFGSSSTDAFVSLMSVESVDSVSTDMTATNYQTVACISTCSIIYMYMPAWKWSLHESLTGRIEVCMCRINSMM